MKKTLRIMVVMVANFAAGTQAYHIKEVNLSGDTETIKIEGFDRYSIVCGPAFSGFDSTTKMKFSYRENLIFILKYETPKIYYDLQDGQKPWARYKKNNLYIWDFEIHLPLSWYK